MYNLQFSHHCLLLDLPRWHNGKEYACNTGDARDTVSIPGSGSSPEVKKGNLLQYSCLENSIDRGAWCATVHGSQRVESNWVCLHTHTHTCIHAHSLLLPPYLTVSLADWYILQKVFACLALGIFTNFYFKNLYGKIISAWVHILIYSKIDLQIFCFHLPPSEDPLESEFLKVEHFVIYISFPNK